MTHNYEVNQYIVLQIIDKSCSFIHEFQQAAVEALNSLQSNAAVLEKARLLKDRQAIFNIPYVEKYLARIGILPEDVDRCLPVIHVSGTKVHAHFIIISNLLLFKNIAFLLLQQGKGSTCAFCESILKYNGLKTGFYSSPHLIEVRERIRINGKPLSKESFARYFWEVYTPLNLQKVGVIIFSLRKPLKIIIKKKKSNLLYGFF